jgi:hypothetical protein
VIDDPDIFRAAKLMIDQYGDEAPVRATRRVEELLHDGNGFGAAIWRQVVTAIEELRGRHAGTPSMIQDMIDARIAKNMVRDAKRGSRFANWFKHWLRRFEKSSRAMIK